MHQNPLSAQANLQPFGLKFFSALVGYSGKGLMGQEPIVPLTFPRCPMAFIGLAEMACFGDFCLAGTLRVGLESPLPFPCLFSRCRHVEEVLQNQRMLLESVTTQVAHKKSSLQTSAKQIEDR